MLKLLAFAIVILCCTACSSTSGPSSAPTGLACDEGHACPDQQSCLYVSALSRYCCGGIACKAEYFACSTHAECGAARKCEGGGCVPCATAGCMEVGDAGVTDMLTATGCADGRGRPVYLADPNGVRQWLCPAIVAAGDIRKKCAPGFELCAAPLYSAGGTELCQDAGGGFFASAVISNAPSAPPPDSQTVCGRWSGAPATSQRFIHGCGNAGGVFDFPTQPCQGFRHAVNCKSGSQGDPSASFSCPAVSGDLDLEQVTNTDPNSGVTCCKK